MFYLITGHFIGDFLELVEFFYILELHLFLLKLTHLPLLVFFQFFRKELVYTCLVFLFLTNQFLQLLLLDHL